MTNIAGGTHIGQGGSWRLNEHGEMECIEPATRDKKEIAEKVFPIMSENVKGALSAINETAPVLEQTKKDAASLGLKINEPDQE